MQETGCPTLTVAHSQIMRARDEANRAVRCFLRAQQPERAVWFASDILALLESEITSDSLNDAAVIEQRADAGEDVAFEEYRAAGETDQAWTLYERKAHLMIAATLAKLAAGRMKHGRTP